MIIPTILRPWLTLPRRRCTVKLQLLKMPLRMLVAFDLLAWVCDERSESRKGLG